MFISYLKHIWYRRYRSVPLCTMKDLNILYSWSIIVYLRIYIYIPLKYHKVYQRGYRSVLWIVCTYVSFSQHPGFSASRKPVIQVQVTLWGGNTRGIPFCSTKVSSGVHQYNTDLDSFKTQGKNKGVLHSQWIYRRLHMVVYKISLNCVISQHNIN
jgi:hypothetical protein